jgi:hypothetical protein
LPLSGLLLEIATGLVGDEGQADAWPSYILIPIVPKLPLKIAAHLLASRQYMVYFL